jgi:hypothetical protein
VTHDPDIIDSEELEAQEEREAQREQDEPPLFGIVKNIGGLSESGGNFFGHRNVGPRRYKKNIPNWVYNNKFIQDLILRSFPRCKTDGRQRRDAGRWATVINLYYRCRYTYSQIADEVPYMTPCKARGIIRSIQRAASGLRAGSRKPRTNNRGRHPNSRKKKLFQAF